MGKRRVAPKLAVLTPIYRGSPIVKVAPGAQKNRRCCAYKQASEWGAAGGGAAARQGDKCGALRWGDDHAMVLTTDPGRYSRVAAMS